MEEKRRKGAEGKRDHFPFLIFHFLFVICHLPFAVE